MNAQNAYPGDGKPLFVPATAPHYENSRRSVEKMEAEMAYEAFEAAVADRDLIAEELRVLNSHRLENKGMSAGMDTQAQATIKGLQGTVQKLEEECESLQAQAHRERSQLMNQINSIESQLENATVENERLTTELQTHRDRGVDVVKHKEIVAAYELEQFATQEAIAHAEAAETDNDRLSDRIEELQQTLASQKSSPPPAVDNTLKNQMDTMMKEVAPIRVSVAERIYSILEDFVEDEEEQKSPVVQHLEGF